MDLHALLVRRKDGFSQGTNSLLRTRVAKAMPLAVGLVVVRLRRRLRWRIVRSRVLLRPVRRWGRWIAVLLLGRIALPLIARWTILRTVLLLLLRGWSVLILLRRILLLRSWIAVRVRAIRIGIGVVRVCVITAVVWISISVRIAIIAAIVGITESEPKSESAASATVAKSATKAAVTATEASYSTAAKASYASPTETSPADRTTAEATATAAHGMASSSAAVTTAPLGETNSGEYQ